jgi:hypothetical protein
MTIKEAVEAKDAAYQAFKRAADRVRAAVAEGQPCPDCGGEGSYGREPHETVCRRCQGYGRVDPDATETKPRTQEESMTPKLTEEEKKVAWAGYVDCYGSTQQSVYAAVEAVLDMREPAILARGRESGIREALAAEFMPPEVQSPSSTVKCALSVANMFRATRLARLLPAKEPTPEQRVEAILLRHKFRADACEYVAAEIVAEIRRDAK